MAENTGTVTRMGFYNGVKWRDECGERWFRLYDVMNVLGLLEEDLPKIDDEVRLFEIGDEPASYVSSSGLARIVDFTLTPDLERMRDVWVEAWYEDLVHVATHGGKPLPSTASGALADCLFGIAAGDAEDMAEKRSQQLGDLRKDVAGVKDSMSLALDTLEDCVTYLDGYRSGALMASGDVPGMSGICSLFIDMRNVEDAMQRIHSRLEDLAGGEDE